MLTVYASFDEPKVVIEDANGVMLEWMSPEDARSLARELNIAASRVEIES